MKKQIVGWLIVIFALFFSLFAVFTVSGEIPTVIPNSYVQDHANVLTPEDEAQIQNQLNQLKIKYNLEFAVATVETTQPRVIDEYALEMARTYGIGAKDGEKRGILLLLAIKDHKWTFQISRHMEAVLTDGQSGSIGRTVLVPALRKAKNSTGYKDAILLTLGATEQQFIKNIEPERKDATVPPAPTGSGSGGILLGLLGGATLLGGGFGLFTWRRLKREKEEERIEEDALKERQRLRAIEIKNREDNNRKAREKAEAEERRREAKRRAYLKTPEGIAETKRLAKEQSELDERNRVAQIAQAKREAEEKKRHQAWLLTPEGKADTARKLKERKACEKREAEERHQQRIRDEARRKREREGEEERDERRRRENSYSPSYSSGSSSYSNSDSSSSNGFGGGGDFSGGRSSGDW